MVETIELYILNWWILQYVNCISIKLLPKKKEFNEEGEGLNYQSLSEINYNVVNRSWIKKDIRENLKNLSKLRTLVDNEMSVLVR